MLRKRFLRKCLISYCNIKSICFDDYFALRANNVVIKEEKDQQTSDDPKTEQNKIYISFKILL